MEVRNPEEEGKDSSATGGLTEGEINLLTSATGYSREDIVEIFGNDGIKFRKEIAHNDAEEVTITDGAVTALGERLNIPARVVNDVESLPVNKRDKKGGVENGEVVVVLDKKMMYQYDLLMVC